MLGKRLGSRLLLVLPLLLLMAAVLYVGFPLLRAAPLTHDHPTHLFKAWHMATHLLPSFRLRGFSHFWVFGFPSDELVPPGEELWVLLFRVLTLGKLTWVKTYGVAILGLLGFSALATYRFTRHYFGTLAGLIAGALVVWDLGDWAQGGWLWMMDWGVWPVTLGISCLLMTVVSLEKVLLRGTALQFALAGAWVGATLLSHQSAILFLPALAALLLFDHWLRRASGARLALAGLSCTFGVALVGFYLIPMLARTEHTLDLGTAGTDFEDVAKRFLQMRLFNGSWPGLGVMALVGAVVGFRRRLPGVCMFALGTALFIALSTDVLIRDFHLERILPSLRKIESLRMLMGAKALWFPLAAYGLSLAFEGVARFVTRLGKRPARELSQLMSRAHLGPAIACLALLPYLGPALGHYKSTWLPAEMPKEEVDYFQDLRALWTHTSALRAASTQHYRIAYDLPRHDHIATLAPMFDNTFMYKVGNTPTQFFVGFPEHSDPRLFRALSVKYVVSDHPLEGDVYTEERKFGKLTLYRFNDFEPRPFTVMGAGTAELLEFSPERIRLRVLGTEPNSRLKLHVSYIDHWRARQEGRTLRIVPTTVVGIEDPFLMEVPVQDGELVFEYVRRAPDWIGLCLTLSAIPLFFAGRYLAVARPRWLSAIQGSAVVRRGLVVIAAVACLIVGVVAVRRHAARAGLLHADSLFRHIGDVEMKADGDPCRRVGVFHWACGNHLVRADRVSGAHTMHLCCKTDANLLEISLPTRADFVQGFYDPRDGTGSLHGWLDGQDLGSAEARSSDYNQQFVQFDTRARKADGSSTFHLELRGSPLQCVDFRFAR